MKGKKFSELKGFIERLLVDYYSNDALDKMLSKERETKALSIMLADISANDAQMIIEVTKGALVLSGYKDIADSVETLKGMIDD